MSEDVAVEDEVADIRSAEVHLGVHLRIRDHWVAIRIHTSRWLGRTRWWRTAAEWYLNHVCKLTSDGRRLLAVAREGRVAVFLEVELGLHLEVNLVLVQFVVFSGVILDMPKLHGPLRRNNGGRVVVVKLYVNLRWSRGDAPGV